MLIPRLITALILIPITLALLYYLPPLPFLMLTSIITLYGAWEWCGLMQIKKRSNKWWYLLFIFLTSIAVLIATVKVPMGAFTFLAVTCAWWLLAFLMILIYPYSSSIWGKSKLLLGIMGAFVLVPFWWTLNFIRGDGNIERFATLVFLLVIIWGADSGAYFVGRKWGKHKLAPRVSPGKSWEGCVGAFITTIIISLLAFKLSHLPTKFWIPGTILTIITIFFSIVGDLFESMIKRQAGMKDSGSLLPGHGGLLDRIDSLTAAAPIFAFGSWLFVNHYF